MQITRDSLDEMDCVMIRRMLQARAKKNKSETVQDATKVVEGRTKRTCRRSRVKKGSSRWWKVAKNKRRKKHRWLSCQQQAYTSLPRWREIFGSSKSSASDSGRKSAVKEVPQERLRKAPPSNMGPVLFQAPRGSKEEVKTKMLHPSPPCLGLQMTQEWTRSAEECRMCWSSCKKKQKWMS